MTILFETRSLTKSFFGITAVNNISLEVEEGKILGLIGQNGAGKSTLMNLIGGVHQPDSGQMLLADKAYTPRNPADAKQAGIAFIHQELNLFTNLTIAENIFIDGFPTRRIGPIRFIDRGQLKRETASILEWVGLDVPADTVIETMSPGERQLAEIAKALYFDARIIIFDEPTTSLTARETERLFEIMRQLRDTGKAVIYISHILKDIAAISDSIAVMRDGVLMAQESAESFTIDRMINLMVGRKLEQLYPPKTAQSEPDTLLQVKNVSAKGLVKDIDLSLRGGEILGLFGLMGSGRTELARIIFGLDQFDAGEIYVEGKRRTANSIRNSIKNRIAFVTENRREEGLLMNVSIADNTTLVSLPQFANDLTLYVNQQALSDAAQQASQILQLKSGDITTQAAKALSGGNQQKVVIAKWLLNEPMIFIMDEPTRGVDVGAKYEIYTIIDQLAAIGSGVLFISSEIEELIGMCDRILVMSQGEVVGEFTRSEFDEERILRAAFREGEEKPHAAVK
ncbi:MAG: sugar ABC transporter ATP-binding protein [Anaerolineaceae bacterium]|nr:sugar ABC transporter ATP-binding protein [Anaerolineaceae bacterium]